MSHQSLQNEEQLIEFGMYQHFCWFVSSAQFGLEKRPAQFFEALKAVEERLAAAQAVG